MRGPGRSLRIEHEDEILELILEYFELPRNPDRLNLRKRATGKLEAAGPWRTRYTVLFHSNQQGV
jgi:hypothetical protein